MSNSSPSDDAAARSHLIELARAFMVPAPPGQPFKGYSTIGGALASSTRVPGFDAEKADTDAATAEPEGRPGIELD